MILCGNYILHYGWRVVSLFLKCCTSDYNLPSSLYKGAYIGQPQGLSLRYDVNFNFNVTDNSPISANLLGGSKPPPYLWDIKFNLLTVDNIIYSFKKMIARFEPSFDYKLSIISLIFSACHSLVFFWSSSILNSLSSDDALNLPNQITKSFLK